MTAIKAVAWLAMLAILGTGASLAVMSTLAVAGSLLAPHPRAEQLRGWPPYKTASCTYLPPWSDVPYAC
jgi:hypothetical protein